MADVTSDKDTNPISKLYNKAKKTITGLFATGTKKKKKPEKKPDYSKRVDIYARGQKRKQAMEDAGNLSTK